MRETDRLIIKVDYGGLGDHLFLSHLPRIAKTFGGYKYVYVSNHSVYRHPDYKKLVWELNPYVDGFCAEDGVSVSVQPYLEGCNLLDQIMLMYGLDDGMRFHEPEIYYAPAVKEYLLGCSVYDPNYISNVGFLSRHKLGDFLRKNAVLQYQMRERDKSILLDCDLPVIDAADVFEYCDIIYSCEHFYCLTSGGAVLASALNKKSTVFYGYGQGDLFRYSHRQRYVEVSRQFAKELYAIKVIASRLKRWLLNPIK